MCVCVFVFIDHCVENVLSCFYSTSLPSFIRGQLGCLPVILVNDMVKLPPIKLLLLITTNLGRFFLVPTFQLLPGDLIRDLFIPKRWRSPTTFERVT